MEAISTARELTGALYLHIKRSLKTNFRAMKVSGAGTRSRTKQIKNSIFYRDAQYQSAGPKTVPVDPLDL